eukprot:2101189-Amphidinium_carterae.1
MLADTGVFFLVGFHRIVLQPHETNAMQQRERGQTRANQAQINNELGEEGEDLRLTLQCVLLKCCCVPVLFFHQAVLWTVVRSYAITGFGPPFVASSCHLFLFAVVSPCTVERKEAINANSVLDVHFENSDLLTYRGQN